MSQMTISGAVSGLDTASIIDSLVSVQKNQQTLLKSRQSAIQAKADAYTSLLDSLGSLGTLTADLAKTSAWTGATATSSSSHVTATATGTMGGSLTFDVTSVAAAHTLISTSARTSTSDIVASSGSLTVTKDDGTTSTIDVGDGSLREVVSALNNSGTGLSAVAVKTGAGAYRLQISSTSTGTSSSFTVDGLDGFDGTAVLTLGSDATIKVGKNADTAYEVTSSTNTFSDLVPGLSFTVGTVESNVTVSSTVDGNAVASKVSKLVDTANSILSSIASKTAYDTTKKTGGAFVGESAVRALQQDILTAVSATGAPGVSVTRDGKLSFDQTAFLTAFKKDPTAVAKAFGYDSTFAASSGAPSTTASVSGALKSARAGTYAVTVTTPPEREQWQVDTGSDVAGRTLTLTRGSTQVSYTAGDSDDLDAVAKAFNQRSSDAGFGVTAAVSGTSLVFTADAAGAARAFTATLDQATGTQVTAGADIAGTIDGQAATGYGNVLSLPSGTGGAVGLSVQVNTTADDVLATGGAVGSITYTPGLAQKLTTLISRATSSTGAISTAGDGATAEVKRYQKEIDGWDTRLNAYRASLLTQFTAMETAISKLKTATSALTQLVSASTSANSSDS